MRITAVEHAAETLLWPKLAPLLRNYPDINIEILSDYGRKDIVAERFDAGVRLGEQVDKDMISMPLAADSHFAVVGAPAYFTDKNRPLTPHDLSAHSCIRLRLPTHGGVYSWQFYQHGNEISVRVEGRATFNTLRMMRQAALDGLGLAYLPLNEVEPMLNDGHLVQMLAGARPAPLTIFTIPAVASIPRPLCWYLRRCVTADKQWRSIKKPAF